MLMMEQKLTPDCLHSKTHVNFVKVSQGVWTSVALSVSRPRVHTRVRSRKCHLLRANEEPAALPVTMSKPRTQNKRGSENLSLAQSSGQRHSPRNPPGPCRHRLHHTLHFSHELETAPSPPTWLTWKKQPVLPFHLFIFCNKLKALFTNSNNCHTVRIYGGRGQS